VQTKRAAGRWLQTCLAASQLVFLYVVVIQKNIVWIPLCSAEQKAIPPTKCSPSNRRAVAFWEGTLGTPDIAWWLDASDADAGTKDTELNDCCGKKLVKWTNSCKGSCVTKSLQPTTMNNSYYNSNYNSNYSGWIQRIQRLNLLKSSHCSSDLGHTRHDGINCSEPRANFIQFPCQKMSNEQNHLRALFARINVWYCMQLVVNIQYM